MEKIISKLTYFDKRFPREALEEAIKNKEEIIPLLLSALDEINEDIDIVMDDADYMLHLYALYLLAEFREERAFGRIMDLVSHPSDEVESMLGDVLTEGLSSILYSTYNGDAGLLQSMIENPSIDTYVRGSALDVYAKIYSQGAIRKDDFMDYMNELISEAILIEDVDFCTSIAGIIVEYHLFEMLDDIQLLYDLDLIDRGMYGLYDELVDEIFSYSKAGHPVKYIDSVIKSMEWWACFEKPAKENKKQEKQWRELEAFIEKETKKKIAAYKKTNNKIGRNDQCPCGSNKKYKRCCIDKGITNEEVENIEFEDRSVWLEEYPSSEQKHDGQVIITDLFDDESICIDKLLYLALHRRITPMWVEIDESNHDMNKILYLTEALDLFEAKCEKEGIDSFNAYDEKYKIHYRSKEWLASFEHILRKYNTKRKYNDTIARVKRIRKGF